MPSVDLKAHIISMTFESKMATTQGGSSSQDMVSEYLTVTLDTSYVFHKFS